MQETRKDMVFCLVMNKLTVEKVNCRLEIIASGTTREHTLMFACPVTLIGYKLFGCSAACIRAFRGFQDSQVGNEWNSHGWKIRGGTFKNGFHLSKPWSI